MCGINSQCCLNSVFFFGAAITLWENCFCLLKRLWKTQSLKLGFPMKFLLPNFWTHIFFSPPRISFVADSGCWMHACSLTGAKPQQLAVFETILEDRAAFVVGWIQCVKEDLICSMSGFILNLHYSSDITPETRKTTKQAPKAERNRLLQRFFLIYSAPTVMFRFPWWKSFVVVVHFFRELCLVLLQTKRRHKHWINTPYSQLERIHYILLI